MDGHPARDVEADGRALLPIACTLGGTEGAQRLDEWRRLWSHAGLGQERRPGLLTLAFRDLPDVQAHLDRLVRAERSCCSFVGWELVRSGRQWCVRVTGSEEALDSLPLTP